MKKIYYLLFIVLLGFASSCTDDFEDMNTDKKNPAVVAGNGLFTNAQKALADQISTPNVNWGVFNLWAQYWTETTYTDEANYDLVNRNIPEQVFRAFYRRILKDLDEAAALITEEEVASDFEIAKQNRLHIIELVNVYSWSRLVDVFGMVPYTDALDIGNVYPVYDGGAAIYADLFTRLNTAINGLDDTEDSFGSADLYYGGDVASWIKFGNTLKIKMAITIADAPGSGSQAIVEAAVAGAFTSSDDDCLMPYVTSSPNYNPIHDNLVASGRDDFVPANTLVDLMNDLNDPRLFYYFSTPKLFTYQLNPAGTKQDSTFAIGKVLIYTDISGVDSAVYKAPPFTVLAADSLDGMKMLIGGKYSYSSPYAQYSHIADAVVAPDYPGFVLTYNELLFYLAEAAERGYTVGGTAASFYEEGITNSILAWEGTQTEVDAYLAQPSVAYATATGTWRQKIATQSWLAAYSKGFVGWTTWRRLDYPVMNPSESMSHPPIIVSGFPVRFTFPINEQTLNGVSYTAAAAAIGGDEMQTQIFWDIY